MLTAVLTCGEELSLYIYAEVGFGVIDSVLAVKGAWLVRERLSAALPFGFTSSGR